MAAWDDSGRDPLKVVVFAALAITLAAFGGAYVFRYVLDRMIGGLFQ